MCMDNIYLTPVMSCDWETFHLGGGGGGGDIVTGCFLNSLKQYVLILISAWSNLRTWKTWSKWSPKNQRTMWKKSFALSKWYLTLMFIYFKLNKDDWDEIQAHQRLKRTLNMGGVALIVFNLSCVCVLTIFYAALHVKEFSLCSFSFCLPPPPPPNQCVCV